MSRPKNLKHIYYGLSVGLLMFSIVSLIGILSNVEPFAIAQRALISLVITTCAATLTARLISLNLVIKK